MSLRGWRSVRFILPVPLMIGAAFAYVEQQAAEACELQTRTSEAAPKHVVFGSRSAALIGDSWAVGDGRPVPAYPAFPTVLAEELGLDLRISAVGGTGYVNGGACGGHPFDTRVDTVPIDAELVILAGGVNDTGAAAGLRDAVESTVAAVRRRAPGAQVVVLGVPHVRLVSDDLTERADEAIRQASADVLVDVRSHDVEISSDDIHPTATGHQQYAELISAALR